MYVLDRPICFVPNLEKSPTMVIHLTMVILPKNSTASPRHRRCCRRVCCWPSWACRPLLLLSSPMTITTKTVITTTTRRQQRRCRVGDAVLFLPPNNKTTQATISNKATRIKDSTLRCRRDCNNSNNNKKSLLMLCWSPQQHFPVAFSEMVS
jgi:hypothetical protein